MPHGVFHRQKIIHGLSTHPSGRYFYEHMFEPLARIDVGCTEGGKQGAVGQSRRYHGGELAVIGYATSLNDTNRKEAFKRLRETLLPQSMFTLNPDGESMTYKGKYTEWCEGYAEEINTRAKEINPTNVMKATGPVWQLQK